MAEMMKKEQQNGIFEHVDYGNQESLHGSRYGGRKLIDDKMDPIRLVFDSEMDA